MIEVFFSIILAIILGAILGYSFIRNDRKWVRIAVILGGNTGIVFLIKNIFNLFEIPTSHQLGLTTIFLMVSLSSTLLSIWLFARKIINDTKGDPLPVTFIGILLGGNAVYQQYFDLKKKEIDKKLKYSEIDNDRAAINKEKIALTKKENLLNRREERIQALLKDGSQYFEIPISFKQPLDSHIINQLPEFFRRLSRFVRFTTETTNDFLDNIEKNTETEKTILVKMYFNWLSANFQKAFFIGDDVRIHFRVLNDDNQFESYAVWSSSAIEKKLTPIPCNCGLIHYAAQQKRSLVKSANLDLHYITRNDVKWEDYLTIIFEDEAFFKGDNPILSMGISVRHSETYSDLLMFLSFIRVEEVIQFFLLKVNSKLPITKNLK